MFCHVAAFTLLLACLPQDGLAFFYRNRLVYSTLDPEPSWAPEDLAWAAEHRQFWDDVEAGRITGFHNEGFYTKSSSEKEWGEQCREQYVQEAKDLAVFKERTWDHIENVFLQTFDILGHKWEKTKRQVRNIQDWITATFFLRDPKAKKNMLNNVEINKFHNKRRQEYINKRWKELWGDIKIYKEMISRMANVYFKYNYPDGAIRTHINNWLGIKNELLEKALQERTTKRVKPSSTRIYDEWFLQNYQSIIKDHADKRKK
ncbi:hypothetical protein M8J75_014661 [Diaphorina citri]|nr:hypothetical protein M8J75_014661 [Diaphorina citri]